MADYFTHFSCLLDVGCTANATQALAFFAQGNDEDPDAGPGFLVSVQPHDTGTRLWIRDNDTGDPEMVIRFVKRCAAAFDAAGIIATLFALSHLSFRFEDDRFSDAYARLYDHAAGHPEAGEIFQAID
ncbi:MAG: antirestriction protein [Paracoccus sp. (in: a-proteobacteria)]|uniref:antirestriction protein n=1 Tax=Rhodobacterales TaxID=204455 RepID=UPI004057E326